MIFSTRLHHTLLPSTQWRTSVDMVSLQVDGGAHARYGINHAHLRALLCKVGGRAFHLVRFAI